MRDGKLMRFMLPNATLDTLKLHIADEMPRWCRMAHRLQAKTQRGMAVVTSIRPHYRPQFQGDAINDLDLLLYAARSPIASGAHTRPGPRERERVRWAPGTRRSAFIPVRQATRGQLVQGPMSINELLNADGQSPGRYYCS